MKKVYRDWSPILKEFKASGMTQSGFAAKKKIGLSVFCKALRRSEESPKRGRRKARRGSEFVEVGAPETIELENGIGVKVRVSANIDPERLAQIIATIARASQVAAQ